MKMELHNFQIGEKLHLNWTSCHRFYSANIEVIKINSKSVGIKLLTSPDPEDYAIGRMWTVKTDMMSATAKNCLYNENEEMLISCYE